MGKTTIYNTIPLNNAQIARKLEFEWIYHTKDETCNKYSKGIQNNRKYHKVEVRTCMLGTSEWVKTDPLLLSATNIFPLLVHTSKTTTVNWPGGVFAPCFWARYSCRHKILHLTLYKSDNAGEPCWGKPN